MKPSPRLTYLESTRGIAALIVLFSHFQLTIIPQLNDSWILKTPLHILVDGTSAVLYFFILSGFVLTLSLKNSNQLSLNSYFKFIVLRFLRIFPAFIFTLLITYLAVRLISNRPSTWLDQFWNNSVDLYSLASQSFLIVRIPYEPVLRLIPHDWTLSIEIAISLLLPLLAYSSRKNSLLVLIFIYSAVKFLSMDPFVFDFTMGIFIASNLDYIRLKWASTKNKLLYFILSLGMISVDFAFPGIMNSADVFLIHHKSWGLALMLCIIISSVKLQSILSHKIAAYFGKISYSFYLQHLIILLALTSMFFTLNTLAFFVVYLSITTIVSSISFQIIEFPFIKTGRILINK